MEEIFNHLISLMNSANDKDEIIFYDQLNVICKKSPKAFVVLLEYRNKAGKSLLHYALESGKDRIFAGTFSLYKMFFKDWKSLPFMATPAFVNNPLFLQTAILLYATKSDLKKHAAMNSIILSASPALKAIDMTTIQSIPFSILLQLCLHHLKQNNFNKEFFDKLKKCFNHPKLRPYWEAAYQDIARSFPEGSKFTILSGEWLPGETPFDAVMGFYLFKQYCELLHLKELHKTQLAAFPSSHKGIDAHLKHLEDLGVLQCNSFHFLHYLCVEMVNNINALSTSTNLSIQDKEALSSNSICCLLELIKKLEGFAAPGYLAAASLYLTLGNHYNDGAAEDSDRARLYYEKSYEALIVAEALPNSTRQIEVAFFGKTPQFIYQIPSLIVAKKELSAVMYKFMTNSEINEIEKKGKILALQVQKGLAATSLVGTTIESSHEPVVPVPVPAVQMAAPMVPMVVEPPVIVAVPPAPVLFKGVNKPKNLSKSKSSPTLETYNAVTDKTKQVKKIRPCFRKISSAD